MKSGIGRSIPSRSTETEEKTSKERRLPILFHKTPRQSRPQNVYRSTSGDPRGATCSCAAAALYVSPDIGVDHLIECAIGSTQAFAGEIGSPALG